MATGQRAFSGQTAAVVHDAILNKSPVPMRDLNVAIPSKLIATIDKALEKDRERRYQSAAEMRADLELFRSAKTRVPWRRFAAALLLIALVGSGWLYWQARNKIKLTGQGTIVLADFSNGTTDPVFEDTLTTALRAELEQTPFLSILSLDKVRGTLRQMGRPEDSKLTLELARDVCFHTNSKAFVAGSITDIGNRYRLGLEAVDCQTGVTLASTEVGVGNRNEIVRTLGAAGAKLRHKLGEPKESIEEFNKPLDEATTSSLQALQAYTLGMKTGNEKGEFDGIPYYKHALMLDPNFARAYLSLGIAYLNLWDFTTGQQNFTKAYELRDRVSQRERFYVEARYYRNGTGELERAAQSLREAVQTYPTDYLARHYLGSNYLTLGQYEKAVTEEQEALRVAPNDWRTFSVLISAYTALGRWEEAKTTFEEARARNLIHPRLRYLRYWLAFAQGDNVAMQEQLSRSLGGQGEEFLLFAQSRAEGYHGRLPTGREFLQRAVDLARHANESEAAAGWKVDDALREAEIGNAVQAHRKAADALALSAGKEIRVAAALAFTRAGDPAKGHDLMQELNREFPLDTLIQGYWLPTVAAAGEMYHNHPEKALDLLGTTLPYEMCEHGVPSPNLYATYLRGLADLKAGQGKSAAGQFQQILDHPGIVWAGITGALARLQLGRAQAMMGDKAAARKSYQDFLTLWKDADPDIPIYKQAKAEYAKLR
jgi:pentatricopeptide repeat protein